MSIKKKIELNSDGIVTNEEIHDSSITEVSIKGIREKGNAEVFCKTEAGKKFSFIFKGIRFFSMNFYGPQNVISDVLIAFKMDASSELKGIKDLEKSTFEKYEKLSKAILTGELALVKIIPSVGAEIVAVCKAIELRGN